MAVISGIVTAYKAVRFVLNEKKKMEADAKAYLSPERAKQLRLWLERLFKALEDGPANPNFARLPKVVRWFCGATEIDSYAGLFGQSVLKSTKLAESNPVLRGGLAEWDGTTDRSKP